MGAAEVLCDVLLGEVARRRSRLDRSGQALRYAARTPRGHARTLPRRLGGSRGRPAARRALQRARRAPCRGARSRRTAARDRARRGSRPLASGNWPNAGMQVHHRPGVREQLDKVLGVYAGVHDVPASQLEHSSREHALPASSLVLGDVVAQEDDWDSGPAQAPRDVGEARRPVDLPPGEHDYVGSYGDHALHGGAPRQRVDRVDEVVRVRLDVSLECGVTVAFAREDHLRILASERDARARR